MRRLAIIGGISAAIVLLFLGTWRLSNSRTFQMFGEIVPRVETSERVVALTFDDGPTTEATSQVLSVLRERGVKATFFVIGGELEQHPELGQRIVQEGHELGNHSYSHERMVFKTPSFIREEIERSDQLIRDTGYQGPIQFRPPYGKKLVLLPYYLNKTHRKSIMWDIEPDSDPDVSQDADKIVAEVLSQARPGSIILLHVMYKNRKPSLNAVSGIIDGLRQQGYKFKTISELLATR
jgi:peptidoglycan-N-acetylglucosamine deacetylase